jgi:membrane associated rhomboid family serine protease
VSVDGAGVGGERFALRDRPEGIVLEADGFHHPRSARGRRRAFTRYEDITHLASSERFVWLGARRAVTMLPRRRFQDRDGPEQLLRALVARIGQRPGGEAQLARMVEVEALGRRPAPRRACWVLGSLCVAGYLLEALAGPGVFSVGYFSPVLVVDGDLWRVFTANLLHGFPLHLLLNLLGLFVVGRMAERALGSLRTACVMGVSALGSMTTSGLLLDGSVVGVSGVVFGLAGAVLWLELRRGEERPSWWRFPRPMLGFILVALSLDVALGFFLPIIAGEAHLGGFVAGVLASALLTPRGGLGTPPSAAVRALAALVVASSLWAVGVAAVELVAAEDYAARHAARLAQLPGIPAEELNNHAWLIAIAPDSSREQMEAALLLAERAVAETGGREATMLDTLAEVQFQLGWHAQAIATIDEAIAREPQEPYYREQRRRFTGDRPADDRPPDPALRPWRAPHPPPPLPPDELGLRA